MEVGHLERGDHEGGVVAEEEPADVRRRHRRDGDRDQGAGADLVEHDLDGEEHAADRRVEGGGDAGPGAGGNQGDALPHRHAQELAQRGAEGGADLDDGPFAADRPAAADRQRGGERLDQRDDGPDHPLVVVDGIHDLGHAVPFRLRGEVC